MLGELSEEHSTHRSSAITHATVRDAVRTAVALVASESQINSLESGSKIPSKPVVVVCGTAFIMAEARAELGVQEPRDSDSLSDPLSTDENSNVDSQVCTSISILM